MVSTPSPTTIMPGAEVVHGDAKAHFTECHDSRTEIVHFVER
jgi:hypothetical protein